MNDRIDKPRRRFRKIVRLLIVIGSILVAREWILDTSYNALKNASKIKSADNLRRIGLAIQRYSQANDGRYPDSFTTLLLNGDATADLFVSPQSEDSVATGPTTRAVAAELTSGNHMSYVYLGRAFTTASVKSDTVIAYESPQDYPAGLGANILFGDGRVQFCPWSEANQIVAKAAADERSLAVPLRP